MIKRFLTYMVALLALSGCSDDFSSPFNGGELDSDGNLHLVFNMAQMQTVTRADDQPTDGMKSVWMYVYDSSDNNKLLDKLEIDLTSSGSVYTGSTPMPKKIVDKKSSAKFVFVANLPVFSKMSGGNDTQTLADLNNETTSLLWNSDKYLTLSSAELTWNDITGSDKKVEMIHNAAKVSVNHGVLNASGVLEKDSEGNYKLGAKYSFNTLGTASESSMRAGGLGMSAQPTTVSFSGFSHDMNEKIIHPTTNTGNNANRSYVIVEAQFAGKNYFYRLDFQEKKRIDSSIDQTDDEALASGNLTTSPLDIKPNHWYQFIIKSVTGPGYLTVAEAAQNPTPMIDYQIHDHAPVIYNMISDGSRELGVSKDVVNNDPTVGSTAVLNVKLFSLIEGEDQELTMADWKKFISIDDDWLTVSKIEQISGEENVGNDHPDHNDRGTVYAVTLQFNNTKNPGTLETSLHITWHGLNRDVPVKWVRNFDTKDLLSSAEIKAFEGKVENWNASSKFYDNDYFGNFLPKKTVGANLEANNNFDRTDGFHFPVRYGESESAFWTYMYRITINTELISSGQNWELSVTDESGNNLNTVYFSTNGSSDWKNGPITGSGTGNNSPIYIRCSDNDYNYYSANFNLKVMENGEELINYDNIKVHHTGFFHKDGSTPTNSGNISNRNSFIKGNSNSEGFGDIYTYYEVVKIGSDYWLDRNIGAKSSNVYIINGYGDANAAGYYVVAADYSMYNDPVIYQGMTPPGYDVPSVEQWDNLRKSSNFSIQLFYSYYNPTAVSDDGKKTMFFPKAQYYEGDNMQGENRAGYYWTQTASTGTEKEEIGNWLKCMTMAGTATSYINGRVRGKSGETPYYMSLRAVSKSAGSNVKRISFWVEGATHVFLYTEDSDGNRNPVTTWPGQGVGSWETMTEGMQFNFAYQYSSNKTEQFYVIFNYVNDKGQIYTMSNNNFSGSTTHTNIRPDDAKGWLVYGTSPNNSFPSGCGVRIDGNETSKEGSKWICSPVYPKTKFKAGDQVRVKWKIADRKGCYMWYNETTTHVNGVQWGDAINRTQGPLSDGYYYRDITIDSEFDGCYLHWKFTDDSHEGMIYFSDVKNNYDEALGKYVVDITDWFNEGEKIRVFWNPNTAEKVYMWYNYNNTDFPFDDQGWPGKNDGEGYRDITIEKPVDTVWYILTIGDSNKNESGGNSSFKRKDLKWNQNENRFEITVK